MVVGAIEMAHIIPKPHSSYCLKSKKTKKDAVEDHLDKQMSGEKRRLLANKCDRV